MTSSGGTGGGGDNRRPQSEFGVGAAVAAGLNPGLKRGDAAGLYDNRNYRIIRLVEQNEKDGYHYL